MMTLLLAKSRNGEEHQPLGFGYGKFGELIGYSNESDEQAPGYTSMEVRQ